MAELGPAISACAELPKDPIPVSKHPMETAGSSPGSSPAMTGVGGACMYVNSKGGWYSARKKLAGEARPQWLQHADARCIRQHTRGRRRHHRQPTPAHTLIESN